MCVRIIELVEQNNRRSSFLSLTWGRDGGRRGGRFRRFERGMSLLFLVPSIAFTHTNFCDGPIQHSNFLGEHLPCSRRGGQPHPSAARATKCYAELWLPLPWQLRPPIEPNRTLPSLAEHSVKGRRRRQSIKYLLWTVIHLRVSRARMIARILHELAVGQVMARHRSHQGC